MLISVINDMLKNLKRNFYLGNGVVLQHHKTLENASHLHKFIIYFTLITTNSILFFVK